MLNYTVQKTVLSGDRITDVLYRSIVDRYECFDYLWLC